MCRLMGVRNARTVVYHRQSNCPAEVFLRQFFEHLKMLHLECPGLNWLTTMFACRAGIP